MNHSYNENNLKAKYKYVLRITTAQNKMTKNETEIKNEKKK